MIISTLTSYPHREIAEDLGIITAFDTKLRPIRMTIEIDTYIQSALQELELAAEKIGADAVLGVQFMMDEKKIPIVIGSAVKFGS
ncbi:hypothetical protein [Vagococcus zengguangii]|uniref:Uncharacterized protein n=1 Tax=Vagococcus zengguangii TaxID=2571750 RepID=A0A4D7CW21_9ENTE|nr:hypothetical protein [Vagococcus zengguangii]QCI86477.1 hypothetical protein FA707_05620 [Vagococcus zengguangii]TLG81273.1 hypothetical protein FE258_01995 [Vagococcus zengguangii]